MGISALSKMAELPKILAAANLLKGHGLLDKKSAALVKQYV